MRSEIYDYIKGLKLKTFKLSEELPFSNSGVVMYLKNPKTIYVDDDQVTSEVVIPVMNGVNVEGETTTVKVFLATDAKQQPSDYALVVSNIKTAKYAFTDYFRKECSVSTEFENDLQVTTFEFRFTKLLT